MNDPTVCKGRGVSLPGELWDEVDEAAEAETARQDRRVSSSEIVRRALRSFLAARRRRLGRVA